MKLFSFEKPDKTLFVFYCPYCDVKLASGKWLVATPDKQKILKCLGNNLCPYCHHEVEIPTLYNDFKAVENDLSFISGRKVISPFLMNAHRAQKKNWAFLFMKSLLKRFSKIKKSKVVLFLLFRIILRSVMLLLRWFLCLVRFLS